MKTANACGVCGKARSRFIMNNKTVCLRCDELLFDLEIEGEEDLAPEAHGVTSASSKSQAAKVIKLKSRAPRR